MPTTCLRATATGANTLTRAIHDRMPAIFDPRDVNRWLTGEIGADALKPAPDDALRMWPVSRRVNCTAGGADDAALIGEVTLAST